MPGTTKQKAMISFMLCTGARIGEAVQAKLSDIEFDKKPVIVRFPARKTKTARKRYSSECADLLKVGAILGVIVQYYFSH